MEKKYFKAKKTTYDDYFILENSILELNIDDKKKLKLYIQGKKSPIKNEKKILEILSNHEFIYEISKPSEEIINSFVRIPDSLELIDKKLKTLFKQNLEYEYVWKTIRTWIFSTKGSPAVNLSTERNFRKNSHKILEETKKFGNGIKSKPGAAHANRSLRTSPICDLEKWENDPSTLLPNGIKKDESMTFLEIEMLIYKILQILVNIYDTPEKIKKDIKELFSIEKTEDYITKYHFVKISFFDFKKNTHHGKEKGLELCHEDPTLEYASTPSNLYIGTCEENRHQGGFSVEFTTKKTLIKLIHDIGFEKDIDLLKSKTIDELVKIIQNNK